VINDPKADDSWEEKRVAMPGSLVSSFPAEKSLLSHGWR